MSTQDARRVALRDLISEARQLTVMVGKQVNPELARLDLTIASVALLRLLGDGPATVPDVARRLLMSRQATQRFADDLTAAGRIERRDNPRHARSPLYTLTAEGRRAIGKATQIEDRYLAELTPNTPVAEIRETSASLARVREALVRRSQPARDG